MNILGLCLIFGLSIKNFDFAMVLYEKKTSKCKYDFGAIPSKSLLISNEKIKDENFLWGEVIFS